MKRYLFSICALIFLVVGACAPREHSVTQPQVITKKDDRIRLPGNSATLYVDPDFSATQQQHIRNAITAWSILSRGRARIQTTPLDMQTLQKASHRILILSETSRVVRMMDERNRGFRVLAFTFLPLSDPNIPRVIVIVQERVSADTFFWVVAHELGHFLGLLDLAEPGHVMSGVGRYTGNWFTPVDLRECQAAGVCP